MRIVLILLALANIALFALTRLDSYGGGEPQRIAEQVQPEKIALLTPQEVAALGPAKTAALADVCLEWGPLSDTERARALADLAPLALGTLVSQRRVETDGYLVTLQGFASRAAAERRLSELRAQAMGDVAVLDLGGGQFAVSLGVYRSEQAANGRADALAQQGIAGARIVPRAKGVPQTMIVIRDPPQAAVARMREVVPAYPGTEVRVGTCERTT
jgi:hypothetical protein